MIALTVGLLRGLRARLAELEAMPVENCNPPAAEEKKPETKVGFDWRPSGTTFGVAAAYLDGEMPRLAFLGREAPGATAPTLGLVRTERSFETLDFTGRLSFSLDARGETDGGLTFGGRIELEISGFEGETRTESGRIDLAGDRLVIPGLGVGANGNGFVLSYFGGLNSPERIVTERETESLSVELGYARTSIFSDYTVGDLAVAIGYRDGRDAALAVGAVPGFARDFRYDQTIDTRAVTLGLKAGVETGLGGGWSAGLDASATAVFADYEGSNRLAFTGFADQVVEGSLSRTGYELEAGAHVGFAPTDSARLSVFASGRWNSDAPVWVTPGGGERARIDTDETFGLSFGVQAEFWW